MNAAFPVLVLAKDEGDIARYNSIEELQRHLEPIDIENEEYAVWDSTGQPLRVQV